MRLLSGLGGVPLGARIAANAYRQSPNGEPRLVGIATNITAQKTDR